MKIGYTTSGFANHNMDDILKILNKFEYSGVEIVLDKNHYHPYFSSSLSDIKNVVEDLGMEVVIGTGGRFALSEIKHEPTFVNPDEKERKKRIEFTKSAIVTCTELNGSVVSGHSGRLQNGIDPEKAFQWFIDGMTDVCDYAKDYGVKFALEPEPGMFIQSMKDWHSIAGKVDVGLCLDIGHVFCIEKNPANTIKREAGFADNIHLEDMKGRQHKHLKLGDGDINFNEILPVISKVDCMVNVELHEHSNVAETTAWESIEKIKYILNNAMESG